MDTFQSGFSSHYEIIGFFCFYYRPSHFLVFYFILFHMCGAMPLLFFLIEKDCSVFFLSWIFSFGLFLFCLNIFLHYTFLQNHSFSFAIKTKGSTIFHQVIVSMEWNGCCASVRITIHKYPIPTLPMASHK